MKNVYSQAIQQLIQTFRKLPGVGQRTAERYVFYLLKSGRKDVGEITLALKRLNEDIRSCEICWDFSDTSPCAICGNSKRDRMQICVVSDSQNIQAIERIGEYDGVYHCLRGTLSVDDIEETNRLKIRELIDRTRKNKIKEVILALNSDLQGETTMMFLEKKIKETNPGATITRLARGLPMGSDLQYADEITLGSALKNRIRK